jgi:hypothetical protein
MPHAGHARRRYGIRPFQPFQEAQMPQLPATLLFISEFQKTQDNRSGFSITIRSCITAVFQKLLIRHTLARLNIDRLNRTRDRQRIGFHLCVAR